MVFKQSASFTPIAVTLYLRQSLLAEALSSNLSFFLGNEQKKFKTYTLYQPQFFAMDKPITVV